MTNFRAEATIGARIKLARRERGYRTTRELADAIPNGRITAAILENIESGRKADISVSQLLNIARTLGVPPSLLLAPIARPDAALDLPNLSADFSEMTAAEFDSWLSATPASYYRPALAAERADIEVLNTLRELGALRRELERLHIVKNVSADSRDADLTTDVDAPQARIESLAAEASRLDRLLSSAGVITEGEGKVTRKSDPQDSPA